MTSTTVVPDTTVRSKQQWVQFASKELGKEARPADIQDWLRERGQTVSLSYVKAILGARPGKTSGQRRRGRPPLVRAAQSQPAPETSAEPASSGRVFRMSHGVASIVALARGFLHAVGDLEECKRILDAVGPHEGDGW